MKAVNFRKYIVLFLSAVVLAILFSAPAFSEEAPKRVITNITGDLYRFQNNFHFSY